MRALLVDDEKPARERLRRLLARYSDIQIVGEAANGLAALSEVEKLSPNIVFLDIEMPELDGLSVAEALRGKQLSVVFVTAYNEHALKAFDVSAVDYLVKPIVEKRLDDAIQKLREKDQRPTDLSKLLAIIDGPNRKLAIRCGAKFIVFDPSQISAIVARDHYAALLVGEREYFADDPIDALVARLSPSQFIRVHRSAAINIEFLKELEREGDRKYLAVLNNKQNSKIPIARERLVELKSRLGIE